MAEVVCLGILVADAVAVPVDSYPKRGQLILTDKMTLNIGGCAANSAIGMSRMGVSTAVIGKVGEDYLGDFVISTLEAEGVEAKGIRRDPAAGTSSTMVMVHSDTERSFIHCIGANATLREEEIDFSLIEEAKVLHIGGTLIMPGFDGPPLARVLRRSKQLGLITALDTAWDETGRWMELLRDALPYIDYLLPSLEEAAMLTGKKEPFAVADSLLSHGVRVVALKAGQQGCFVKSREEEFQVPAFKVKVVDSTGAGDAFVAGFLTGVVKDWELLKCAQLANATGAMCVMDVGTTRGLRSLEETLNLLEQA